VMLHGSMQILSLVLHRPERQNRVHEPPQRRPRHPRGRHLGLQFRGHRMGHARSAAASLRRAAVHRCPSARGVLRAASPGAVGHGRRGRDLHVAGPVRTPLHLDAPRDAARPRSPGATGSGAVHRVDRGRLARRTTDRSPASGHPDRGERARRGRHGPWRSHSAGRSAAVHRGRAVVGDRQRGLAPGERLLGALALGLVLAGRPGAAGAAQPGHRRTGRRRSCPRSPRLACCRVDGLHRGAGVAGRLLDLQRTAGTVPSVHGRPVRADRATGRNAECVGAARPGARCHRARRRRGRPGRCPGDAAALRPARFRARSRCTTGRDCRTR
ncbi:MAG: hypothetical protein JWQ32_103, partial [Marmoricola sp.]|nr:hypothetical protein [Marmoricola sp.]